jgi:hypothetical protein
LLKSLIASNTFGENFKVIVPLISFYEERIWIQSISDHNELNSKQHQQMWENAF